MTTAAPARRHISSRTRDDLRVLVGAATASLATTWLFYERVLPLSGKVGFVVCWYLLFVAYYAAATAVLAPRHVVIDRVMTTMVVGAPVLVAAALGSMIVFTFVKAWAGLTHVSL